MDIKERTLNRRLFKCEWDGYYYPANKTETHTADWFTSDKGYDLEEIESIMELRRGQCMIIDVGHKITRIN